MADNTFVWVTHHVPMTRWLKAELAKTAPDLKFAFSRPGLSTFKAPRRLVASDLFLPTSFGRACGLSLGMATSVAEALALATSEPSGPLRLHVFERDTEVPIDEQDPQVRGSRARAVEAAMRARAPSAFLSGSRAQAGDRVLDVIVPHANLPDEPWLVGTHQHNDARSPWPGGVPYAAPPPEAPSRAWSKIEEALSLAGLDPAPGDHAVEIGAAPGGATYALLRRGLTVYGVDPGDMHPTVLHFRGPHGNRFVHLHTPAAEVDKRDLPRRFEWLLLDVNLAPMIALRYAERFIALSHQGLKGAVLTLKLNDDNVFDAIPRLLDRIAKMGPTHIRVAQLPSHRSEIAAILTW